MCRVETLQNKTKMIKNYTAYWAEIQIFIFFNMIGSKRKPNKQTNKILKYPYMYPLYLRITCVIFEKFVIDKVK